MQQLRRIFSNGRNTNDDGNNNNNNNDNDEQLVDSKGKFK
jgi:hypothetical protein